MTIQEWAKKWCLPHQALEELSSIGMNEDLCHQEKSSESRNQSEIRLNASRAGSRLWRNNVGAFKSPEGAWVRYGLCNESKRQNEHIKSSDLIGIRPLVVTPEMVGTRVGQFVAREMKESGWRFRESDSRAVAQKRFIDMVNRMGGDAAFNNSGQWY